MKTLIGNVLILGSRYEMMNFFKSLSIQSHVVSSFVQIFFKCPLITFLYVFHVWHLLQIILDFVTTVSYCNIFFPYNKKVLILNNLKNYSWYPLLFSFTSPRNRLHTQREMLKFYFWFTLLFNICTVLVIIELNPKGLRYTCTFFQLIHFS